jgi:hypothetical protein
MRWSNTSSGAVRLSMLPNTVANGALSGRTTPRGNLLIYWMVHYANSLRLNVKRLWFPLHGVRNRLNCMCGLYKPSGVLFDIVFRRRCVPGM